MAAEDYNPVSVPSFLTDGIWLEDCQSYEITALITAPLQLQLCHGDESEC